MSEQKIKVLAIFGESCSGKDTLVTSLLAQAGRAAARIVHTTTRSPRPGESEGISYHYTTDEKFITKILNGDFISYIKYGNGTWYGSDINSLDKDKVNVGSFSIGQVKDFLQDERIDIVPVYLYAMPKDRLLRAINRDTDYHEICRRFLSEEQDYETIPFEFLQIISSNFYNPVHPQTEKGLVEFIKSGDFKHPENDANLTSGGIWTILDN